MRGISLPIETIVVVAVTVLVLVVVVAFFISGTGGPMSNIGDNDALARGCVQLSTIYGCNPCDKRLGTSGVDGIKISGYVVSCGGFTGSLAAACCKLGFDASDPTNAAYCAYTACRCPGPCTYEGA